MKTTAALAAAATAAAIGVAGAPYAFADNYPVVQTFGTPEQLVDRGGTIITSWRVDNLQPSTDVVPWAVHGALWEANATVDAIRGTVTPVVSNFNARTDDRLGYGALAVPPPQGINPAPLDQGARSSGKLYFDVVGPPPTYVGYSSGGGDLLFWMR